MGSTGDSPLPSVGCSGQGEEPYFCRKQLQALSALAKCINNFVSMIVKLINRPQPLGSNGVPVLKYGYHSTTAGSAISIR